MGNLKLAESIKRKKYFKCYNIWDFRKENREIKSTFHQYYYYIRVLEKELVIKFENEVEFSVYFFV